MATLRDIKRRIKGVQSTQKITKAMKMVAAAKLRRAQEAIINARPYAKKIYEILSHLASEEDLANNPFLQKKEIKNVAIVVVTADRGLCGAFNSNIIKETSRLITEEYPENNVRLFCIGRKSFEFFSKRDNNLFGKKTGIFSSLKYDVSLEIYNDLVTGFLNDSYQKVIIIYNEFKSIIQQKIVVEQFLPVSVSIYDDHKPNTLKNPYFIFEPDQKYIFDYLLPKHLKAQLWRILLESNAAELGAQMTAMDNATTNAKELIRTLQLKYNKERQAAITKEILEIVSGANALKTE